jgi:ABC-type phosphate/phosphonate transport system substrate-binding protein
MYAEVVKSMSKALLMAMAAALLGGCRSPQTASKHLVLKLAVNDIYCSQTACACVHYVAARNYTAVQEKLREWQGIDLQLDFYIEPYELEKAILSGDYHGAICKPWTALMLEKQAGTRFERVADILDPNNNRWLTGVVVVLADSGFQSLEDLQGKHIVMGEADAYEKHFSAKRLFEQKGITFSQMDMSASCIENLGQLMDGQVDAAVVSDYALTADCAVDFAKPEDFRILEKTERIPLTSVLLDTKKTTEAERLRLQAALRFISSWDEIGDSMLGKGFVDAAEWNPPERGM